MSAPLEIGHDHQGKALFRLEDLDEEHLKGSEWDDLEVVLKEISDPNNLSNHFTFSIPWSDVKKNALVPRYYHGLMNRPKVPDGCIGIRLGYLFDESTIDAWLGHGSPSSDEKGQGDIPYVRVSDIVNWELY